MKGVRLIDIKSMLGSVLAVQISVCKNASDFKTFENHYCMDNILQPSFTAIFLQNFTNYMNKNTIYKIEDSFDMSLVIASLNSRSEFILIGPFCESEWDTKNAENILINVGVSISYLNSYRVYRRKFSILETSTVVRAISVLTNNSNSLSDKYEIIKPSKQSKNINNLDSKEITAFNNYYFQQVERRYQIEQEMIKMITSGNYEKAYSSYLEMVSLSSGVKFVHTPMWSKNIGSTILRTTIRIAAQQSGLHPMVIDTIMQNYAKDLYTGKFTTKNSNAYVSSLLKEICDAIKNLNEETYSHLIKNIIAYINFNLGRDITLKTLSEEFHFSKSYLSSQFKQETGVTIVDFVTNVRIEKAAELLLTSDHKIQDISSYVGYLDNNYFVKVFKSKYKMTPTQYRKYETIGSLK